MLFIIYRYIMHVSSCIIYILIFGCKLPGPCHRWLFREVLGAYINA